MKRKNGVPEITFVVLSDTHRASQEGKIDCLGIFTDLFVWAFPAYRECSFAFGLSDLTKGHHEFSLWLKHGRNKAINLSKVDVDASNNTHASIFAARVPLPLTNDGLHYVGISSGASVHPRGVKWIPLKISKLPWPKTLEGDALSAALDDPHSVKRAQAAIQCQDCKRKYTFEVRLDPSAKPTRGARAFPEDGTFPCLKCKRPHFLKDIEGQLRSQLGKSITGETK